MTVKGTDYNVVSCSYNINQPFDEKNLKVLSKTKITEILVTVESSQDNSLLEWTAENLGGRDGTIVFNKTDQDQQLKSLKFEGGLILNYKEIFGVDTMMIELTIFPVSITIGSTEINNT